MPIVRLIRTPLFGRPRRARVSTPFGWIDVKREGRLDVIEGEHRSGTVAALVASGWTLDSAPVSDDTDDTVSDDTDDTVSDDTDDTVSDDTDTLDVGSMTVREIKREVGSWPAERVAQAIISERMGKNRKSALAALGVEVE